MKKAIIYVAAGLLILGGQTLRAEDASSTNTVNATTPGGKHSQATAEENKKMMAAIMKDVGITPADLDGLSPKEKRAKVNAAIKTKMTELKAKETAGTLSDEEKKELAQLTKFQAHHAGHKKAAGADTTPAPAPAPAQ